MTSAVCSARCRQWVTWVSHSMSIFGAITTRLCLNSAMLFCSTTTKPARSRSVLSKAETTAGCRDATFMSPVRPAPTLRRRALSLALAQIVEKLIYAPLNYAKEKRPLAVCLENVHTLKTLFPEVYNELTKDPVYEKFWSCWWHLRRSQWVVAHGYKWAPARP